MTALGNLASMYRRREHLPAKTRLLSVAAAVLLLHCATIVMLLIGSAAAHPIALGLVVTAYLTGVKHSYDWDHVAAIDNSTRKFAAQHKNPLSVGFAFSLGHSSVVVLTGVLIVSGVSVAGRLIQGGSTGTLVLQLTGSAVSGLFLLLMGIFNGSAFLKAAQAYRKAAKGGGISEEDLEPRGFMARLLSKPLAKVQRPRNIYVIGFLFGLGFDTATTIGLLVMTTAATLAGVSPVALLTIPLAFAAAMTLCDSLNGIAMMRMYRSAIENPQRRLGFNTVITGLSAFSALLVAILTLSGLVNTLGWNNPATTWLAHIDLGDAGLALVCSFAVLWAVATLLARRRPL